MTRRTWKKLTAIAVSVAMIGSSLTGFSKSAKAEEQAAVKEIATGVGELLSPSADGGSWKGSYIWFGKDEKGAIRCKVLDKDGTSGGTSSVAGSVLLQADHIVKTGSYDAMCEWLASDRGMLSGFTEREQKAMTESVKPAAASSIRGMASTALQKEKLFSLDLTDLTGYGYTLSGKNTSAKADAAWWLRSTNSKHTDMIVGVSASGELNYYDSAEDTLGIIPAVNVDTEDIRFVSSTGLDKTDSLKAVKETNGNEWKLTLKEPDYQLAIGTGVTRNKAQLSVPYTLQAGDANQISVLITKGDYSQGDFRYYGKAAGLAEGETSGTAQITLPDDFDEKTDQLYLLEEKVGGAHETDYAGTPVKVDVPALHTHVWSSVWSMNEEGHWHACTVTDPACDITDPKDMDGYEEHDFSGTDSDGEDGAVDEASVAVQSVDDADDADDNDADDDKDADTPDDGDVDNPGDSSDDSGNTDRPEGGEVIKEPTCSEEGIVKYTCKVCGYSYTDSIDRVDHDYTIVVSETPATCEEDGVIVRKCTWCDETDEETIEATGHEAADDDEGVVIKPATCEEEGTIQYTCTKCGQPFTDDIDALGHEYSDPVVVKQPTFKEPGVQQSTCIRCGDVQEEEIPAGIESHKHEYTSTITKQPTCTQKGVRTYTCKTKECGDTYTEEIAALGHQYGEWQVTVAPTSETEGVQQQVCSRCGDIQKQAIQKLPPQHVHDFTNAQWQSNQNEHWRTCSCGQEEREWHTWNTGKVLTKPTRKKTGSILLTCSKCQTKSTREIPKIGTELRYGSYRYVITGVHKNKIQVKVKGFIKVKEKAEVIIPDTIDKSDITYYVTSIGRKAFRRNDRIKEVILGDNITSVGNEAFFGSKNIMSMTIGKNVSKIGTHAFCRMHRAKVVTIRSMKIGHLEEQIFHKINKNVKIKIPKKKAKRYKKLFKKWADNIIVME